MYKGSYDDNFFYKGAQLSYLDAFVENATQVFKNLAVYTGGLIDVEKVVVDKARLRIDDIHFLKDAYVSSSDTAQTDLRAEVITLPRQFDYINIQLLLGIAAVYKSAGVLRSYIGRVSEVYKKGTIELVTEADTDWAVLLIFIILSLRV